MGSLLQWVVCCLLLGCSKGQEEFFKFGENVLFGCYNISDVSPEHDNFSFPNSLTLQNCLAQCKSQQNTFFGVSSGTLCTCFKEQLFQSIHAKPVPSRSCFGKNAVLCSGNSNDNLEYCGTSHQYLIYTVCPRGMGGTNCWSDCTCANSNNYCQLKDNTCTTLCFPGYDTK